MRVRGDSEQCAAAAEALGRAAFAVAETARQLRHARGSATSWSGSAQDRWAALAMRQSVAGDDVALRLGRAAGALTEHAERLRELQTRAARLVQEAAEAGLHLGPDGWIAPVPLSIGVGTTADQEPLRQVLVHQQEARAELLRRVAVLRADETSAHEQLMRALRTLAEPLDIPPALIPAGPPSIWAPTWWDVPTAALGGAAGGAGALPASALHPDILGRARGPVRVLRSVPLVGVASTGYGVYVDTEVNGMGTTEAVTKNVVVTAIGTGATVTVTAVATTVGAPATVVVVAAVGVGAVVGWGVGRAWDAVFGSRPGGTVARPAGVLPAPSPADRRSTAAAPGVPRPAPGPSPQAPPGVHSPSGRSSPAATATAPSS